MGDLFNFSDFTKRKKEDPANLPIKQAKDLLNFQAEIFEALCRHSEDSIRGAGFDVTEFEVDPLSFKRFFDINICDFINKKELLQICMYADMNDVYYRVFSKAEALGVGGCTLATVFMKLENDECYLYNDKGEWNVAPDASALFEIIEDEEFDLSDIEFEF